MLLRIALLLGALLPSIAFATTPVPTVPAQAQASAESDAKSHSNAASQSAVTANQGQHQDQSQSAVSGSTSAFDYKADSNFYVLPAPITGGNLPSGFCQRSSYHHVSFVWNFVSVAEGGSFTDLECLEVWGRLQRLLAEKPVATYAPPPSLPPETSSVSLVPPPLPDCSPHPKSDKTAVSKATKKAKAKAKATGLPSYGCKL